MAADSVVGLQESCYPHGGSNLVSTSRGGTYRRLTGQPPRRYVLPRQRISPRSQRHSVAMWGKGNSHDEQKIPAYRITNTFYVVEKHLYTIKKSFYLLNLDEIGC